MKIEIQKCCKNCPNRTVECHSTCEEYARFLQENEKLKEKRRAYNQQKCPILYKRKKFL